MRKRVERMLLSLLFPVLVLGAVETTIAQTPGEAAQQPHMTRKVSLAKGRKSQCQQLWAKQAIAVGNVCLEANHVNPEELIVSFTTKDGWRLDDAHLWIGRNISEVPMDERQEPPTTPLLDLFSYSKKDLSAGQHSTFGFVVKLWYLDFVCPDSKGTEFAAAAHATVRARSAVRHNGGPTRQQAWAALEPASTPEDFRRQWLDFSFTLVCDWIPARPRDAPERHHANQVPS